MGKRLVCGVGVNDADYKVFPYVGGKRVKCHFYTTWCNILLRCYNKKIQGIFPSYKGCSVCDEWLKFSSFKLWMESQDWKGNQIDKDILSPGNKVYRPEFCVFVTGMTNGFTTENKSCKGEFMVGVHWSDFEKKFVAQCHNQFTEKRERLGGFGSELDAHKAWKRRKHELACQLAELQTDKRVANALRTRYL